MASRAEWLVAVLLSCSLASSGCAPVEPSALVEQAVRDYVAERYGTRLVTDRSLGVAPSVIPDNAGERQQGPGVEHKLPLEHEFRPPRRFEDGPPAPKVRGSLDDCDIPAKLVDVQVVQARSDPANDQAFEVEYKATQELEVDLYELVDGASAAALLGVDHDALDLAVNQARQQPGNLDLHEQWFELRRTRGWALKLAHQKGTQWVTTGQVKAEFGGGHWTFQLLDVKYLERPSAQAVTIERQPLGLVVIDPEDPKSAVDEWKRPFDAFRAIVSAREAEYRTNRQRQPELLKKYFAAGQAWRTQVAGSAGIMDIELMMEKVTDEGTFEGIFVGKSAGRENRVKVSGRIEELSPSRLQEAKYNFDKLPFGLHGMAVPMSAIEDPNVSSIWNRLKFALCVNPKEDAPTLVWLERAKKLELAPP